MKKGLLTTVALTAGILALSACGGGSSGGSGAGGEMKSLSITNKEALQASFRVGDSPRTITIESDPVINVREKIASGDLVFKSNNLEVVSTAGAAISAVGVGTTTVEAIYKKKSFDSVEITVSGALTPQEKYGITHAGTEADPLDNTDALKVAEWSKNNSYAESAETFYIKGIVERFYHAPGQRDDGLVSWFLQKASTDAKQFEVYKATKENGDLLTDDDIWVGAEVLAKAKIYYYADGNQAETSGDTHFVRVTGGAEKPSERIVNEVTFAQALSAGAALGDGADTYNYYQFDAYVSAKDGSNYFLTATQGEELVKATSDADHGERSYYSNAIEIFSATDSALTAKLKKNAKVTVKMVIKNYHGQVENALPLTADDVTVVTEGGEWVTTYEEVTFAQALAAAKALDDSATSTSYYKFQGEVTKVNYSWSDSNKNMSFTMKAVGDTAESPETIYSFKISEEDSTLHSKVAVGAIVTVGGKLQNYVKDGNHTYELVNGLILAAEVNLTGISLSQPTASVAPGGTLTLTVSPKPAGADLGTVVWAVENDTSGGKIEVTNGLVSVASDAEVGKTATIKATCGEFSATCVVTVASASTDEGLALSEAGADFTSATKDDTAMPDGCTWTYITNNASYPDPSFNNGGFKFSYVNQGLKSAQLVKSSSITVTINVGALNAKNSTTEPTDSTFTVYGLGADESTIDTKTSGVVSATGNVVVTLTGTDLVYVKIMLTGFGWNGSKQCNVRVDTITLA